MNPSSLSQSVGLGEHHCFKRVSGQRLNWFSTETWEGVGGGGGLDLPPAFGEAASDLGSELRRRKIIQFKLFGILMGGKGWVL